jgi:hypothetical protein
MADRFPVRLLVCLAIVLVSASPVMAYSFSEGIPVQTGHDVAEFAIGDVDGDDRLDLVTVSTTAGNIKVRFGIGGAFGSELTYTAPSPTEIMLGDLDGDGFLDIIVASEPSQTPECVSFGSCAGISVLLNDGDGTFGPPTTTPVPYAAGIVALDTADFTADGKLDVLAAGPPLTAGDPALHTFFGDNSGGFTSNHSWTVDGTLHDAVAAKLTAGSGQADVVALLGPGTSSTFTRVVTYASQSGTFPAISGTRNISNVTSTQAHLTTADFNGNGTLDIAASFRYQESPEMWGISVVLANGPASLAFGGSYAESMLPVTDIVAEDVDEDGDVDVMLVEGQSRYKAFRRQSGNFLFDPEDHVFGTFELSTQASRVLTGDFNGDGRPDFVFLGTGNDTVRFLGNTYPYRYVKATLSSSPNPSTSGGDATFTVSLQQKPGAPTPEGTVTLFEGETILGEATVNEAGNAFITLSSLSVGTHSLRAQYVSTNDFANTFSNTYQHTVSLPPFGPPPNVTATGNAAANKITVRWSQTAETATYEIRRRSNGAWITVGSAPGTDSMFIDSTVNNSTAYVYAVRALRSGTGELSLESNSDIATTTSVLLPSDKKMRATDITTTRTLVNSLRTAGGLTAATFTDPSLTGVKVKAVHLTELRTALNQARTALGLATMTFTHPTLTANTTPARAIDIQEIRNSLQ